MENDTEPSIIPESRFVEVNGIRLHYVDWGNEPAPTLVLLHGYSSNVHTFDQLADRLRHEWHVVALDQRGHGDSWWARDGYDRDRFVADFEGFIVASDLAPFSLLGHSMGGLVGIEYVAQNPNSVDRFVVVDIGPEIERVDSSPSLHGTIAVPEEFESHEDVYAFLRAADPLPPDEMLRYRAKHGVRQMNRGRWTWKSDRELRIPTERRRAPSADELWAVLALISCPTLVVRGQQSAVLARHVAQRMERTLPNGRLVEVERAGHRITLDNLDGLEREVRRFLTEQPKS